MERVAPVGGKQAYGGRRSFCPKTEYLKSGHMREADRSRQMRKRKIRTEEQKGEMVRGRQRVRQGQVDIRLDKERKFDL